MSTQVEWALLLVSSLGLAILIGGLAVSMPVKVVSMLLLGVAFGVAARNLIRARP